MFMLGLYLNSSAEATFSSALMLDVTAVVSTHTLPIWAFKMLYKEK